MRLLGKPATAKIIVSASIKPSHRRIDREWESLRFMAYRPERGLSAQHPRRVTNSTSERNVVAMPSRGMAPLTQTLTFTISGSTRARAMPVPASSLVTTLGSDVIVRLDTLPYVAILLHVPSGRERLVVSPPTLTGRALPSSVTDTVKRRLSGESTPCIPTP